MTRQRRSKRCAQHCSPPDTRTLAPRSRPTWTPGSNGAELRRSGGSAHAGPPDPSGEDIRMSGFFAPDSAAMRFLTRIADLMILNLLFIATSIPIVTLGASVTALNFTAMRIVRGQCDSVTGDYFGSFRRNFRQATLIGLIFLLLGAVFGA